MVAESSNPNPNPNPNPTPTATPTASPTPTPTPTPTPNQVAESSAVVYKLDKTSIDFGLQQYDRIEDKEMFIFNTGKVPVTFSVLMASLSRSNVLEVLPGSGRIAAGDKQRLAIRLLPGLPTKLREAFHVQVAHFEPEEVVVTAEGIYPRIAINLPRDETDAFTVSSIIEG